MERENRTTLYRRFVGSHFPATEFLFTHKAKNAAIFRIIAVHPAYWNCDGTSEASKNAPPVPRLTNRRQRCIND
jgi:hypothetical protein